MLRATPLLHWLGAVSLRNASLVLVAGTLLGIVLTLIAGGEPGLLLGFCVIVGSIIATLAVRRGAVYLFFPLPALAFFVAALIIGPVHDSDLGSLKAVFESGFLQWTSGIFIPGCVATVLVLLVGAGRWLLAQQLVTGQFTMSGRPGAPRSPRPAASARRPVVSDPWADQDRPGAQRARTDRGDDRRSNPGIHPRGAAQPRAPRQQSRDPQRSRQQPPSRDPRARRRDPWDER